MCIRDRSIRQIAALLSRRTGAQACEVSCEFLRESDKDKKGWSASQQLSRDIFKDTLPMGQEYASE
eukprot:15055884-Alexandrium_andersonii.AAC.1